MPGIIRVGHRRSPYVVIDRRPLEDAQLSWAARGLLGYLLAKPDDWQVRVSDLCRRGDLGRDGIHRVLQQLQDFGYKQGEQGAWIANSTRSIRRSNFTFRYWVGNRQNYNRNPG